MKRARFLRTVLLTGGIGALLSCGESTPVGVTPVPQADLIGGLLNTVTKTVGLLTCSKLPYDSVTQVIGKGGGVIYVGPHTFVVPSGALSQNVAITAVAPSAHVSEVLFQPDGLQFNKSASLTLSYANCNLLGSLLPREIARVDANLNILDYLLSVDNMLAKKVTGRVDHFTGYAVAW